MPPKTMLFSDLFIAFSTLCLFIFIAKGYKDLSFFYLLSACRSIGSTFHAPALKASIPLLVPKHHLVRVSGLYHSIQPFSEVIAPVVGASLVVWLPVQYILLIDVIGAVAACLTLLCVQVPSPQIAKAFPDFKEELTECWHTLRRTTGIHRFCLSDICRRHSLFHLSCAFHRHYSAELGFGYTGTDIFSHL